MGKITGFLEFERSDRDYEPVEERIKVARIRPPAAGRGEQEAGGTLHGLRHSLLPHRLSGEQPDPGLIAARTYRLIDRLLHYVLFALPTFTSRRMSALQGGGRTEVLWGRASFFASPLRCCPPT